jgi:hypothetical protein
MREATPEETAETLAFALLYEGRKRIRDAESMMASITAKRLVEHLRRSGYVVMKGEPAQPPRVP